MSDTTDEIKHRLDIIDFIQSYVTLKKAGNNWKGLCPFHSEKTPSFMVSREKQIYKCFGCSEGGDVFSFLMKMENLEFPEALEILANRAGVVLPKKERFIPRPAGRDEPSKNQLYAVNQQAGRFFHTLLTKHWAGKEASQYLKSRGIHDESIKRYRLGYAPLKPVLKPWLAKQGFQEDEINRAGSPDRFYHRIMFPMFDVMGNVVGFTGRALRTDQEPKYLHTAETVLFHKSRYLYGLHQAKQAIKERQQVAVVEGQLDVIASAQAGVAETVAPSGTALTDDQLKILGRYTDTILFGFDQDQAGQKATDEAVMKAISQGLSAKIISFPEDLKDPGEFGVRDPRGWAAAVDRATHYIEWVLTAKDWPRPLTVETKKKIAKRILPVLAKIPDPIEQAHWVGVVSQRLAVPADSITKSIRKFQGDQSVISVQPAKPPGLSVKEYLLALFEKLPDKQKKFNGLYDGLKSWYTKNTDELVLLFDHLHAGILDFDLEHEFTNAFHRYHDEQKESVKQRFAEEIAQAEVSGDRKKAKELVEKLMKELREKK